MINVELTCVLKQSSSFAPGYDEMESFMKHGYYWLQLKDQEPEVVEIDGDSMYRCGSDVTCLLEDGRWMEFGEPMDVVLITGPIMPPHAT
jgi:hypothetical protein